MASIYEIDSKILACVDIDTGEVIEKEQLEALQIERSAKVEGVACWIKNLEADAEAIKAEEKSLKTRREAKENKVASLKEYLKYALDNTPFESAKCKVSFRKSTQVNIIDASAIPAEYIKTETLTKIDKEALGAALKSGELIDGAELKENSNIQVR